MSGDPNAHPFLEALMTRHKLALQVFFAVILILGAGALLTLQYSASAVLALDPQSIMDAGGRPRSAVELAWSALPDKQIAATIQQFRLNTGFTRLRAQDDVFGYVRSNISLHQIASDGSPAPEIMLSYTGVGPSTVMGVTNALAQTLAHPAVQLTTNARQTHVTGAAANIAEELANIRSDLQLLSQAQNVKIPPDALQQHAKTDTDLRAEREQSEIQLAALEQEDQENERSILNASKARVEPAQPVSRNPAAIALEQQIKDAQARLTSLRQRYTDEYPDVVEARQAVAILQEKLHSLPAEKPAATKIAPAPVPTAAPSPNELRISQQEDEIRARQNRLDQAIAANENEVAALRQRTADAATIARDYATEQQRYNTLLKAQQEAGTAGAQDSSGTAPRFMVIESATTAEALGIAVKPLFWILGLLAALLSAGFAVFLAEQFGPPVDDEAPSRGLHTN